MEEPQGKRCFAQNSRFYRQVMEDGYIFNPYIHRRFIAVQFRRLIQRYGCQGIEQGVAQSHNWDYALEVFRKEVHKLANLAKHDRDGYMERSRFFTLERCANILADYAAAVSVYIDRGMDCVAKDCAYIPGYGTLQKANVRPMKHRFTKLAEQAGACKSHQQLDNLLSRFEWLRLPKDLKLPFSFVEPFTEEGAYYTMKHHMMFEGLRMWSLSQKTSLEQLRTHNGRYLDLYQSIMK